MRGEVPQSVLTPSVRRVATLLRRRYGRPRLQNKGNPLDELVFILLSAKTAEQSYVRTYKALRAAFPDWFGILAAPPRKVRGLIASGGLSVKKERQLRAILRMLHRGGTTDLERFLRQLDDHTAERFLEQLPGIGRKSAKCVLMYSMGRRVLPVDTHVARVFDRLGWYPRRRLTDRVQAEMERLVPPELRYSLHVDLVVHGRAKCTPRRPNCPSCPVRSLCPFPGAGGGRAA